MERRIGWSWAAFTLLAVAGCSQSPSAPSTAADAQAQGVAADPAAQVAHSFLDAIVRGDSDRANALLTPVAIERIKATGKTLKLLGLENYTFRVEGVRHPTPDQAYVHCFGKDKTAAAQAGEEEYYWMLRQVDNQWRIWAISYTPAPNQPQMIYSLENPEMGAVPVQQVIASASKAAAAPARPSPVQGAPPTAAPAAVPPAGSYR